MVIQELAKRTMQKKWVKFGLLPFIGLLGLFFIINFVVITYQNNHITEADEEYVDWFNEHYESFSEMDDSIDQLADDFQTYRENHTMSEREPDVFFEKAFGVYPKIVDIYNYNALDDLIEEAKDQPMPNNRKLKIAHKTYLHALEQYSLYAASVIVFIDSNGGMEEEGDMLKYRLNSSGVYDASQLVSEIEFKID